MRITGEREWEALRCKKQGLAKEKSAEYLRLFVVDRNEPAIRLYRKNGWNLAGGIYEEVIDEGLVLREYGFETAVAKK
jgi:ribosomal protein S18 acetylase RimI-like enzyme